MLRLAQDGHGQVQMIGSPGVSRLVHSFRHIFRWRHPKVSYYCLFGEIRETVGLVSIIVYLEVSLVVFYPLSICVSLIWRLKVYYVFSKVKINHGHGSYQGCNRTAGFG